MDKQPLYSIETLFQQKLEELPVDASQQQEQWRSLSKAMHKQPAGFRAQLQKPMGKLFYMTAVALIPFGIFYVSSLKEQAESSALNHSSGKITRSLLVLNQIERSPLANKPRVLTPMEKVPITKETHPVTSGSLTQATEPRSQVTGSPSVKHKDSTQAMPVKTEKPITKKADSTYIYWQ